MAESTTEKFLGFDVVEATKKTSSGIMKVFKVKPEDVRKYREEKYGITKEIEENLHNFREDLTLAGFKYLKHEIIKDGGVAELRFGNACNVKVQGKRVTTPPGSDKKITTIGHVTYDEKTPTIKALKLDKDKKYEDEDMAKIQTRLEKASAKWKEA
jgi:hypothetical protein